MYTIYLSTLNLLCRIVYYIFIGYNLLFSILFYSTTFIFLYNRYYTLIMFVNIVIFISMCVIILPTNYISLLAMDILVLVPMKNAANCEM